MIRGLETDDDTLRTTEEVGRKMGKETVSAVSPQVLLRAELMQ